MEKIPAASAMDWSIDLDRGLRSRHPGTRLRALEAVAPRLRQLGTSPTAPAAVASAFGVQTMLLRVATEFRSADNVVRSRIVRSLLTEYRDLASKGRAYDGALGCGRRSPTRCSGGSRRCTTRGTRGPGRSRCGCSAALPTSPRTACTSALSCSPACAPPMLQRSKRHCLQLVKLSEDFSCITLEVLTGSICSPRSEAQVIVAAIEAFSELDCTLAVIHRVHEVFMDICVVG